MKYKLTDIFDLQMGKTPDRSNLEYWNSGTEEWISIADLSRCGKYITETKEKITKSAVEESKIKCIPENTVIMSFKLSIGKLAITEREMYSNEAIMAFIDKKIVGIVPSYLYYLFMHKDWNEGTNKAVMGKTLNKATLSQMSIEIHEVKEQQKIVRLLDTVYQLIEGRKKQLEELDNLIKSQFVEMFGDPVINPKGWAHSTLKEIAIGKLSYGSGASAVEYDGKCRYIRITDITNQGDLNNDIKSPNEYDKKYILNDGDILFARSGATVGKTVLYKRTYGECIYAGYLIRLVPNRELVIPEYVFNYTKTDYYNNFIASNMKVVAQPNINAQQYGDLMISLPPLELQNQFATFVQQVDKLKFEI